MLYQWTGLDGIYWLVAIGLSVGLAIFFMYISNHINIMTFLYYFFMFNGLCVVANLLPIWFLVIDIIATITLIFIKKWSYKNNYE
jgi:Zn-dependent protease